MKQNPVVKLLLAWVPNVGIWALVLFLTSCASTPTLIEPVGPKVKAAGTAPGDGKLLVFSARHVDLSVDVEEYFRFTSYEVRRADGRLFRRVDNNTDATREAPEAVALPAGFYTVIAQAEKSDQVSIPVVIEPGSITEVHLELGWLPPADRRDRFDLVVLPDGRPVGWRASVQKFEAFDPGRSARADAIVKAKMIKAPDSFGKVAYALVEPVAVLRNRTEQRFRGPFTVGYTNVLHGPPPVVTNLYLHHFKLGGGAREWRLVED